VITTSVPVPYAAVIEGVVGRTYVEEFVLD
jgi:hypothetical protein